ncbi:GPI inositol-deacylase-like protein [Pseudomassariella vexata]|uniref:GPI inositol-deacylase n=1 Tax=Pseudomassariella vexata TaxID=1141098 RepID=A0A1Y2DV33_9PEZI|nr:GPI inositol-deacylase-like protein [Pseudomassariella vexata]ORY63107.1 GPI inositol-deacylase-like protein [Pseudomassariella vexata]
MKRRSSGSSEGSVNSDASNEAAPARSNGPTTIDDHPKTSAYDAPNTCETERRERKENTSPKPSSTRIRRPSSNLNWKPAHARNGSTDKESRSALSRTSSLAVTVPSEKEMGEEEKMATRRLPGRHLWSRSPWTATILTILTTLAGLMTLATILNSSVTRQFDPKGCRMAYTAPRYVHLTEFDTEHTRFATKYTLHLYREGGVHRDGVVRGTPVLFIPGNAGSYKQVRSLAGEAARYFHDELRNDPNAVEAGIKDLDFFTVDFNEDFTAFHGQTMLDQAEYLNEAIRYILSLYLDPRTSAPRDPDVPDPSSVIVVGHSMGGIVARTMLIMPNYQSNSINTIVTMSAPHARPPISFDSQIVKIYDDINTYWRHAYSQKWANNNPLWHVTLVSIAGGNLDTVVPSDYASVESIVPETHGFTVFTTTIPTVWTSVDHAAILWCDQFRKVVVRALYDVVDTDRAAQTKPRAERLRVFKKWFLTGMEDVAEKSLPQTEPQILLTLDDNSNSIIRQGERLILRELGGVGKLKAHLIPVPPIGSSDRKRFTLLTDTSLDQSGGNGKLEVLFCSIFPLQPGQSNILFSMNMDISGDSTGSTRLACKNAASDLITLPRSTRDTKLPFFLEHEKPIEPISYLQYDLEDVADHQFVAVIDKATTRTPGWVVAEFSDARQFHLTRHISLRRLLTMGMQAHLPSHRPLVTDMRIPSIQSSLLAYSLEISEQSCNGQDELFAPLVRQFITEPYESKFFVNARQAKISIHGVAPYVPPPMKAKKSDDGLSLQFWTDPSCDSSISIQLKVDLLGSLGKLYMRYRTVFAAFPLLVVTLVLRKQFRVYDSTGVFISFLDSLGICLRQSLPLLLLSLTLFALSMGRADGPRSSGNGLWPWRNSTAAIDYKQNDLLIGTADPFFWFLVPMIGLVCIGVCTAMHYMALSLTYIFSVLHSWVSVRPAWIRHDDRRRALSPVFMPSSPRRRLITTGILLFSVSTFIPYQFAYLVACLVQLSTSVRGLRFAREVPSPGNSNFCNYSHSILLLMLWVLPINMPTLVVWVRNLAVRWFTPFSSHHNVLSILPFILLVETLTTGKMVPRVTSRLRHVTSVLLFGIAVYAAIYGVSHAYMLHYLVNLVAAWLIAVHSTADRWSLSGLRCIFDADFVNDRKQGKTP